MPNNILRDVLSDVLSDPLQDVFASDAVVAPAYNVVSLTQYFGSFSSITYWDMTETSGSLQPNGADTHADLVMSQTGAGAITYNTTFTTYAGADGGYTYDGTQRFISPTDFSVSAHPTVLNVGDQTLGYIFDTGGTLTGNASVFFGGGSVASSASNENTAWYSQLRTDYQNRYWHEYSTGSDEDLYWNAIPPDSQFSGEQMQFFVRDVTANNVTRYIDSSGTLSAGSAQAFTNDPTNSGVTNKILFGGRNGDTSAIPQSGFKQGLIFSANETIAATYLQTMIDKARTAASSGSIYFEADLS